VLLLMDCMRAACWLPDVIHIFSPTCRFRGGVTGFSFVVDPLLLSSTPNLPVLATSVDDDFPIPTLGGSSKVVVEGMPPVH